MEILYALMDMFIFFYYYDEKEKNYNVTAILRRCSQACQASSKIKKEKCQMEARKINKKIKKNHEVAVCFSR